MKTGIFITARLGSTRLKQKHLLPASGRPLIRHLIDRIEHEFSHEIENEQVSIVITTSDEPENRGFENVKGCAKVFYGSLDNIPLRHLQAANHYGIESIINVDGDDILCSVQGMRALYNVLKAGSAYAKTSALPFGMNSFGYSTDFLSESLQNYKEDQLETGWGRIFDEQVLIDIQMDFDIQDNRLRFTLDYEADYRFFKDVIESFGPEIVTASDEGMVQSVLQHKFYEINAAVSEEYWRNFNRSVVEESQNRTGN